MLSDTKFRCARTFGSWRFLRLGFSASGSVPFQLFPRQRCVGPGMPFRCFPRRVLPTRSLRSATRPLATRTSQPIHSPGKTSKASPSLLVLRHVGFDECDHAAWRRPQRPLLGERCRERAWGQGGASVAGPGIGKGRSGSFHDDTSTSISHLPAASTISAARFLIYSLQQCSSSSCSVSPW